MKKGLVGDGRHLKELTTGKIIKNTSQAANRIMIGIPTTGLIRYEWAVARYHQIVPCNWSHADFMYYLNDYIPSGFQVADGRNIIVHQALANGFEWLMFIDHDTILPPLTLVHMNEYMLEKKVPVVCGLYFTKSIPSEPLVYRGHGTSYYNKWKFGDKVWVDGIPMGCTLINCSIFKAMAKDCEEYELNGTKLRKYFNTPGMSYWDMEAGGFVNRVGTEDLDWCARVIDGGYLKKAGWKDVGKQKYPFLIDTNIFCLHIDQDGVTYPSRGEEQKYAKKKED
jgi:hypothetical protein